MNRSVSESSRVQRSMRALCSKSVAFDKVDRYFPKRHPGATKRIFMNDQNLIRKMRKRCGALEAMNP